MAEAPERSLVSFNLLDDRDERPAAPSAFASLFDRMRAAFVTQPERGVTAAAAPAAAAAAPAVANAPAPPAGTDVPAPRRAEARARTSGSPERLRSRAGPIMPLRTVPPSRALAAAAPFSPTVAVQAPTPRPDAARAASPDAEAELANVAQSVPGFPLGHDVLEDSPSLASMPLTRSEAGDETMSTLTFRPVYPSADAWIRRFRGEGLSRKYWMADETAKECRDCLLPFTPLRRRHHCRICGQIFCHRCCSNIVPGARFGHRDAIRTCNQCLCMLQEYDRREAIDAEHRAAASARSDDTSSIAPLSPTSEADDVHTPQAQFAATTLFAHDAPTRGELSSSPEAASGAEADELADASLADASLADELTPFRAGLDADDAAAHATAPLADDAFDARVLPVAEAPAAEEPAPDAPPDAPPPAAPDAPDSPVRRTARQKLMRGASRFVTSTALGAPSLVYFLRMLHQVLVAERIGDVQEWKETVKLLALSVVERVRLRTRTTALTDIRQFVKIKCLPGGRIADCEFLDGYICSKNVATKRMASFLPIRNARIMVVAFPLEYHRNANQLMSLEPIMAQEHEFIRILVARILALRPNVVIAEKSVSYYALQLFEEAGVAVFWSMKRSSVDVIARCTQADIVASIDRLALDPRLGRCACLTVDTYAFAHEPGRRKPLLRIEVLSKDVSSGLVLRGASIEKLRRIKAILALMVFVGYNLKLEEHVRRDMGVTLDWSVVNIQHGPDELPAAAHPDADEESHRSHLLTETLRKYHRLLLSASLSVILPPPFLVTHMKQVTDRLHALRAGIPAEKPNVLVYELAERPGAERPAAERLGAERPGAERPGAERPATDDPARSRKEAPRSEAPDALAPAAHGPPSEAPTRAPDAPSDTPADTPDAPDVPDARASPAPSASASTTTASREERTLGDDEPAPHLALQDPRSFEDDTELTILEAEREAMQHSWKSCVSSMAKMLTPFAHQKLVALVRTTCAVTQQTCTGPALQTIEYYGAEDEPLGRMLERTVDASAGVCPARACDRANLLHYTTYQHNEMCVQMVVERFACPLPGEEKHLLCWSYCKACGRTTPVVPLSEESWSFSFAKYLELQFYPNRACHPTTCEHDYYRDSVRYFALRNLAIRFHADPVQPWEVVVPPMHLLIHEDKQIALKNEETISLFERNAHYWDSVCARLAALQHELRTARLYTSVPALKKTQTLALKLLRRILAAAHTDHAELQRMIAQVYWDSGRNLIEMNDVRRVLQDKVVAWDGLFLEFEKRSTVPEREIRRLLHAHLARDDEETPTETPSERASLDTPGEPKRTSLDVSALSLWDVLAGRDDKAKGERSDARDGDVPERPAAAPTDAHTAADAGTRPADAPPAAPPSPVASAASAPAASAPAASAPAAPVTPEAPARPSPPLAAPRPVRPGAPLAALPDEHPRAPPSEPRTASQPASPAAETRAASQPTSPAAEAHGTAQRTSPADPPRAPQRADRSPTLRRARPTNPAFASFAHHRGEAMALRPPWEPSQGARGARRDDKRVSRTQVSSIARHFDQLSREAERERERQWRTPSRTRRARPVTSTHATVEVFKNLRDAVGGDESDSDSEREARRREAHAEHARAERVERMAAPSAPRAVEAPPARSEAPGPAAEAEAPAKTPAKAADAPAATPDAPDAPDAPEAADAPDESLEEPPSPGAEAAGETSALFARLGETWTLHCGELTTLAYPFPSSDHLFSDSRVVVREDEPSSIIAFTLHSKAYREQLLAAQQTRARTEGAVPPVDEQSSAEHLRDLENELRTTEGTHFGYEFDTGAVKLWCKIFFAEQFDALRHMYGCSESIVQSLSRCYKWDSGGGKSGSAFLKTRDDRLVVKQLSRAEMDGFSKFAPQYFAYVADCKAADRPTTLTKIFGYFRIGFRNAHTGKSLKLDVVVMENLVYGHDVYKIFDLKGSTRNRLRPETGRAHEVLLDENLVQLSHTSPVLVREHSKRILRAALYNDSLFLTDMNVMDYSLIVVLDAARNELVIGIIDYLRTYTWDKRVESFVKETAILGGGGKGEPTIITPRQYRMRFLSFLDRYFWMTPDPWVPDGWVL